MFDVMSIQAKSPVLLSIGSSHVKIRQKGGFPFPVFSPPVSNIIKDNQQYSKSL